MEIEFLRGLPAVFLTSINDLLNDKAKYNELISILKRSNLTFQSKTLNNQLTITSVEELEKLKRELDQLLQTAEV